MSQSGALLQATVASTLGNVDGYIKGLRGVFRVLTAQHREAASLLARMSNPQSAQSRAVQSQQALWAEARQKLLAHERAEVEVVYSLLASLPNTEQLAQRHHAGASELELAIAELDALACDDPVHGAKLADLRALLAKHATQEEGEYFVRAQAHIGMERAESLLEAFERAYRRQLHQLQLAAVSTLDDDDAPTIRRPLSSLPSRP